MNKDYKSLTDSYKAAFGTENGRKVLEDLQSQFHVRYTTFKGGPTDEMVFNEGERAVVLYIQGMMAYNSEQTLTEEGSDNE